MFQNEKEAWRLGYWASRRRRAQHGAVSRQQQHTKAAHQITSHDPHAGSPHQSPQKNTSKAAKYAKRNKALKGVSQPDRLFSGLSPTEYTVRAVHARLCARSISQRRNVAVHAQLDGLAPL